MDQNDWLERPLSLKDKKIWIAGHTGLVGSALLKALQTEPCEILTCTRQELDLRNQAATNAWIATNKPNIIILAAATVGGIGANSERPAEFLYDNLIIETNIIHAAHQNNIEKLLFLGSSCIYPKEAQLPISEDTLLSGPLEPTNDAYAIAKIAGIKLCQSYRKQYGRDFIAAMPCNLYGPGDRFDEQASHVIPALMMKAHKARQENAKTLNIWGSGEPLREFLYVDDLASAIISLLKNYSSENIINVGSGEEISIATLAQTIVDTTGFKGTLNFDTSKPDGTFRKVMDSSRILSAGWKPKTDLRSGLQQTYNWYCQQSEHKHAA